MCLCTVCCFFSENIECVLIGACALNRANTVYENIHCYYRSHYWNFIFLTLQRVGLDQAMKAMIIDRLEAINKNAAEVDIAPASGKIT